VTLGFSDQTVSLLPLVPLVHVGWVDGRLTPSASERILDAAHGRGVDEQSEAGRQLKEWLATKPSDGVLAGALHAIRTALRQQSVADRERYVRILLDQCASVAAASGGVWGFGAISKGERAMLDRIRRELDAAAS
jgi:hypothetical protein